MSNYLIGLDVGSSNIKCIIYDIKKRKIIKKNKEPFKKYNCVDIEFRMNIIQPILETLKTETEISNIIGIGITTGALFDRKSGQILNWPNHKEWNGFKLLYEINKVFKSVVLIEEDANSATIAELLYGSAKDVDNFAYITVSTGIGCGLVLNGELYTGQNGFTGEIGHIPTSKKKAKCSCGLNDCFQSIASGKALINLVNDSKIRQNEINCISELSKYEQDVSCYDIFVEAGEHIAQMILSVVMLLDLSLIVIGGGVILNNDLIRKTIEKSMKEYMRILERQIAIKVSNLGDYNGTLGVLSLLYEQMYNEPLTYY